MTEDEEAELLREIRHDSQAEPNLLWHFPLTLYSALEQTRPIRRTTMETITSITELESLYDEVVPGAVTKVLQHLSPR